MKFRLLLACLLFTIACTGGPEEQRWIGSWGASPLPPTEARGPFPATPGFRNQTIRQTIRLSAGGSRVRVRLGNEYGIDSLTIGTATISRAHSDGTARLDTIRSLTFGGRESATIAAGAAVMRDAVDLAVDDLESLSIAL